MSAVENADWTDWLGLIVSVALVAVGVNAYLNDEALWLVVAGIVLGVAGLGLAGASILGLVEA